MWFTLTGRLHTRLASLIGPLVLTLVVATVTGDSDYWLLFALMVGVGLILETGVYGWLIGYQPRWLTIVLGILEFLLLKWIIEWPYPFEIRLHTRQALAFYVVAWLLMWLTTQVVLPVLWPRWTEDGGEFRPAHTGRVVRRASRLGELPARRNAYLTTMIALVVVMLPWLAAMTWTPTGQRFIGLLWLEQGHLQTLADVTAGSQGAAIHSPGHLIGQAARLGRWSVLTTYHVAWVLMAFCWLLGINTSLARNRHRLLLLAAFGGLPLLLLPATWLLPINIVLWLVILASQWRPQLDNMMSKVNVPLAAVAVLVWMLLWLQLPTAPYTYVREDVWQALSWLSQSLPPNSVVIAPPRLVDLVEALGGQQATASELTASTYHLLAGAECAAASPLFAHGQVCIVVRQPSRVMISADTTQ